MHNNVAAIMQVKNESAIIKHSLSVLKQLVDRIIIIDDNSDDNTVDLIRESNDGKITLLQNKDKDRNEGREFQKCLDVARDFGCTRMYISDADEIVPQTDMRAFSTFLRETNESIRIIRTELCCDQMSFYGQTGSGKMVVTNINGVNFNSNSPLHQSQPITPYPSRLVEPHICTLLHYGQADYEYTIFKLLFYIMIEHRAFGKRLQGGYIEYFKTYENFVESTENPVDDYLWESSPIPYRHWMPEEIRMFCRKIGTDFNIVDVMPVFMEFDYCKKYIAERAWN